MADSQPPLAHESFAALVHDALSRLYDSPHLQAHPLGALLLADGRQGSRSQALRRVLLDALEALRPSENVPTQARDWRSYRALELRYVEGYSPAEVMAQLALGRSQFFRDQGRMLELLVDTLWQRYQEHGARHPPHAEIVDAAQEEIARVLMQATWEVVDASQLVRALRPILQPIADTHGVALAISAPAEALIMRADRVLLRQVVLQLSLHAMRAMPTDHIELRVEAGAAVGISVCATWAAEHGVAQRHDRHGLSLADCQQLVVAMGGALELRAAACAWSATAAWHMPSRPVLLVIDDNADFVELLRRYLADLPWLVLGAPDGEVARRAIAETRPTLVLLDVMLPREDGWELLLALGADVATRSLPVVICSALREPDLAPTLGAAGYLAKPVTQPALLHLLDAYAHLEPARP